MPRFDMHCHTKEGSIDAKISIKDYIKILKSKGFDGMLVTDHDSYKGYRYWRSNLNGVDKSVEDFTVLMGAEYDTCDAGHFIVIMPDGVELQVLQIRGMSYDSLTEVVHKNGGILGPAHPFGARSSSAMFCNKLMRGSDVLSMCDFFEGFNTCETRIANQAAITCASRLGLPCTGGSDSHKSEYVGSAYTDFSCNITCNNDMIDAIKSDRIINFGGQEREFLKKHIKRNSVFATYGFRSYNRALGVLFSPFRSMMKYLALTD
ncbi:PHP domain-containing protein [Anaerovoracaceae bacterium SGI.195]